MNNAGRSDLAWYMHGHWLVTQPPNTWAHMCSQGSYASKHNGGRASLVKPGQSHAWPRYAPHPWQHSIATAEGSGNQSLHKGLWCMGLHHKLSHHTADKNSERVDHLHLTLAGLYSQCAPGVCFDSRHCCHFVVLCMGHQGEWTVHLLIPKPNSCPDPSLCPVTRSIPASCFAAAKCPSPSQLSAWPSHDFRWSSGLGWSTNYDPQAMYHFHGQ